MSVLKNKCCSDRQGRSTPASPPVPDIQKEGLNRVGERRADLSWQGSLSMQSQKVTPHTALPCLMPCGTSTHMWLVSVQHCMTGQFASMG